MNELSLPACVLLSLIGLVVLVAGFLYLLKATEQPGDPLPSFQDLREEWNKLQTWQVKVVYALCFIGRGVFHLLVLQVAGRFFIVLGYLGFSSTAISVIAQPCLFQMEYSPLAQTFCEIRLAIGEAGDRIWGPVEREGCGGKSKVNSKD